MPKIEYFLRKSKVRKIPMTRVSCVNNSEPKVSMFNYAAMGALGGYALKYTLPLTEKEKNLYNKDFFTREQTGLSTNIRKEFIENIENAAKKNPENKVYSTFLAVVGKKGENVENLEKNAVFQKSSKEIQNGVEQLMSSYSNISKDVKNFGEHTFNTLVKTARSAPLFIGVGALAGVVAAVGVNALNKNGERLEAEYEKEKAFDEIA